MTDIIKAKLACGYFFVMPALCYGTLSARLPALQSITGANDAEIGTVLLSLGICTFIGLLGCGLIIEKFQARTLAITGCCIFSCAMICASAAPSWILLALGCGVAGLGVGLCDVAMNALGIEIEQKFNVLALSSLHGASSAGGMAGSLAGSFFAFLNLSPFINFLFMIGIALLVCPLAVKWVIPSRKLASKKAKFWEHIPAFILLCGILSLVCHVVEGSAAEWGSILMHSEKGASEQEAALTFACFTGGMVVCRFIADKLRIYIKDWLIFLGGSLLGAIGIIIALISPWPVLCLAAYAIMGFGLAPIVPVLFSRGGAFEGISAGRASAVISIFSYSGMLFLPPLLGYIAQYSGLVHALWILVACCVFLTICSPMLVKKR